MTTAPNFVLSCDSPELSFHFYCHKSPESPYEFKWVLKNQLVLSACDPADWSAKEEEEQEEEDGKSRGAGRRQRTCGGKRVKKKKTGQERPLFFWGVFSPAASL